MKIMKFVKKPIVIEAMQFKAGMLMDDIAKFIKCEFSASQGGGEECFLVHIKTPSGEVTAYDGDWIIKGIGGEIYPCKPEIFHACYELTQATTQEK